MLADDWNVSCIHSRVTAHITTNQQAVYMQAGEDSELKKKILSDTLTTVNGSLADVAGLSDVKQELQVRGLN